MGPLIPGPDAPAVRASACRRRAPARRAIACARDHARRSSSAGAACAGASTRSAPTTGCRRRAVGQPVHGAAAALPRRQHPRARLRPPRPAASVHYVGNCLWFPPPEPGAGRMAGRASRPTVRGCTSPRARSPTATRSCCARRPRAWRTSRSRSIVTTGAHRDTGGARPSAPLPPNVHVDRLAEPRRAAAALRGRGHGRAARRRSSPSLRGRRAAGRRADDLGQAGQRAARRRASARASGCAARRARPKALRAAVRRGARRAALPAPRRAMAARLAAAPGPPAPPSCSRRLAGGSAASRVACRGRAGARRSSTPPVRAHDRACARDGRGRP